MKISITQENKIRVKGGGVGLCFEDVNYALDGGLYAEMLENRNFEAKDVRREGEGFKAEPDGGYAWEVCPQGADVALKIKDDRALFPENPHYLRLTVGEAGAGIKNKAYDGMYLTRKAEYKISFYARSYNYKGGAIVGVYADGAPCFEKKVKIKADGKWHRFEFRVRSKTDAQRAEFRFTLNKAGVIHLDCFSMIPANALYGVFRRDLAQLMKDVKPAYLRFPGGCLAEGNSLANRYHWKSSIGQPERRKYNWNRWAVHAADEGNGSRSAYSHYGQTLGVGYYEFFRLCEYLGAKPFPVVSVGIACQDVSTEFVPLDDPDLETYILEALDVVEFANGGTDTVWGRVRAEMGHPEPFGLELLGLGNEQWETAPSDGCAGNEFQRRFELFERRIHEKYPDLKIVGTAGPSVGSETHGNAWKWTRENLEKNPNFVYATDEHFYVSPEWLLQNAAVYDGYPRNGLVCAGEYAALAPEANGALFNAPQANAWQGALAEAAFLTGMERNSDVVVMSSYAPLFARLGYTQWSPALVWFDGSSACCTASYYVQKLFSLYRGDESLQVKTDAEKVYASAVTRDSFLYLKVVNAGEEAQEAEICGDFEFGWMTQIIRLTGELADYNVLHEPEKITPVEIAPTDARALTLPPHSFQVLVFRK